MTHCLRRSRTRRSTIVALMAIVCAVSIAPVVAALPVPKEADPVPMVTIPAGEFLRVLPRDSNWLSCRARNSCASGRSIHLPSSAKARPKSARCFRILDR